MPALVAAIFSAGTRECRASTLISRRNGHEPANALKRRAVLTQPRDVPRLNNCDATRVSHNLDRQPGTDSDFSLDDRLLTTHRRQKSNVPANHQPTRHRHSLHRRRRRSNDNTRTRPVTPLMRTAQWRPPPAFTTAVPDDAVPAGEKLARRCAPKITGAVDEADGLGTDESRPIDAPGTHADRGMAA
jgi:hypothetical protein